MTMSNTEVVQRSELVQAKNSAFANAIEGIRSASAVDETVAPPPASSSGGKQEATQTQESSGGGCGGFLKIISMIAVVVCTIWFPAAVPAAMALNQAASQIPAEGASGSEDGTGVDVQAMQADIDRRAREIEAEWRQNGTLGPLPEAEPALYS